MYAIRSYYVVGLVVAILSFGLLQTVVDAWYAGAEGAAPNRLITRNAVSLMVPLPVHYRDKIRSVDGVKAVAAAIWFAGVYQDPKNFFPQFAVEPAYFTMYPEYRVPDAQFRAFRITSYNVCYTKLLRSVPPHGAGPRPGPPGSDRRGVTVLTVQK